MQQRSVWLDRLDARKGRGRPRRSGRRREKPVRPSRSKSVSVRVRVEAPGSVGESVRDDAKSRSSGAAQIVDQLRTARCCGGSACCERKSFPKTQDEESSLLKAKGFYPDIAAVRTIRGVPPAERDAGI